MIADSTGLSRTFPTPALAACGQGHAAFERRCIPPEPRLHEALGVAFRSEYTRYSSLTRLVSRAPWRSRCSRHFIHRLLAGALVLLGLACSSGPLAEVPTGAQADRRLLALGQQSLEDRDWETARTWFRQLLDSYPRSQFAGDARLGIADTYNNQRGAQNALLAATEYRDYLTFFPNHPRADYAQFQIAFGHFKRRRSADRDQEDTELAATEFEKLLELYPNSRYAEEARGHLVECRNDLATSVLLKAEFYQDHRNWCRGAIPRLEEILATYPEFDRLAEVRHRLGRALTECGREQEALVHYQKIVEEHSESPFTEAARERIREILART